MDFAFLRRLIAFSSQKSAKNKLLFTFHEFWVVQKANDKYYCRSIKFGFQYFCWLFNGPSFFSVFFSFFFIKSGSDKKNDWKSPVPHVRRIWVTVSIRHESASKLNIMPRQRQNGSVPFITLNASFLQFVFLLIFTLSSLSSAEITKVLLRCSFSKTILSLRWRKKEKEAVDASNPSLSLTICRDAFKTKPWISGFFGVFFFACRRCKRFGWFQCMSANRD